MLLTCAASCLIFAVSPRNLRAGALVFLNARAMGSKRLLSNSPKPESSPLVMNKKDKKLKGSVDVNPLHDKDVVKSIKDEPGKIEAMTVQELRTTLRSVGVPAKGCKSDLVSTLKCFLDDKTEGADEKIPVAEECVSSEIKTNSTEAVLSKREAKNSKNISHKDDAQDIDTVLEVSGRQRSMTRVKQSAVKDKIVTTKQELSIKINEVLDKKRSGAKRKVSSEIGGEVVGASDLVEPWMVLTHKKPQQGWIPYNPKTMRPPPLLDDTRFLKLMSWNVNGLRALLKLEGFSALQLAQQEDFDVLCLQETKLQEKDVEAMKQTLIDGYENSFWTCSVSKLGYSGTAIVSRIKPLSVRYGLGISDHDSEGRLVTAEFDSFYLINGYVPNSGDGLKRLSYRVTEWDPSLSSYMKELEKSKPVILTGDLNCAHQEIDIHNPAGNRRSAGFTDEERESFEKNFLSRGFVDTFRKQHPDAVGYTYWGYRHGGRKSNKGWRLDYFLVSESITDKVHDSYILPDVGGSDHCPIGLILKL